MFKIADLTNDTLFRGIISGLTASILKFLIDLSLLGLGIIKVGFWNYAAIVIFNRHPQAPIEFCFASVLEIIFSTFWGVVFCWLLNRIKTRHSIICGAFFGSLLWFFFRTMILAFKIEQMLPTNQPFINLFTFWALSMLFGAVVATLDQYFARSIRQFKN